MAKVLFLVDNELAFNRLILYDTFFIVYNQKYVHFTGKQNAVIYKIHKKNKELT